MNSSLYIFIFLLIVRTIESQCTDCVDTVVSQLKVQKPEGYKPWGNNLYKAYNVAKNWNNAQQTCQGDNGNLAIINSREEAQFVQQLVINARPITGSTYPGGWVGFRDSDGGANWQTLTGQNLNQAGYDVWWRKKDRAEKNKCGAIKICGRLSTVSCNNLIAFVCEIKPSID
ncbi:GSCOCG00008327001-RA-CDS [Cotesia congregata]|nr:GSCOCG00008327001-RA-CDS [Cotesia congregata]